MSASIVGSVLDRYNGKPHLKVTLLALADAANSHTGECNPSYELIAGQTNSSRSTAIRNVAALIDEGMVQVLDQGGFRTDPETGRQVFVSNLYRINLEMLAVMPTWRQRIKSKPRKPSHGSTNATVSGESHGRTPATLPEQSFADSHGRTDDTVSGCGQPDTHSGTDDTVSDAPVRPCSSSTGATLTKTLEPRPEGQGLSTSDSLSPVGLRRAAKAAQRRDIRSVATDGLVAHRREKAKQDGARRYVDKTGRILSAGKGLGESFMTLRDGHRVKSPALPVRDSLAEAQQDLDVYATVKALREYR